MVTYRRDVTIDIPVHDAIHIVECRQQGLDPENIRHQIGLLDDVVVFQSPLEPVDHILQRRFLAYNCVPQVVVASLYLKI